MARIINRHGGGVWEPNNIPTSKPFINIITSPLGQLVTQDDVHFIKTKSSVYSVFHPNARQINFEVGYSAHAKWFEYLKEKWNDYMSFYIGGFIEGVYSVNEKGQKVVYIQVDAKSIDYDPRNRTSPNSSNSPISSSPKSSNAFALRRNKISHISSSEPAEKEVYERNNESNKDRNTISIDDDVPNSIRTPKKCQLSDLCDELDQAVIDEDGPNDEIIDEPIVVDKISKVNKKGRGGREGRRK